jgi:hypothetical protein
MSNPAKITFISLGILAVVFAGVSSYVIKTAVLEREQELQTIRSEIDEEEDRITVLEADWSYLTRPSRIQHLSKEMLSFAPVEPGRILSLESLNNASSSSDDDLFKIKTIKELE